MANQYDLIVVGAGYAGLMAAKTAGEKGLKTALIEMKHDITKLTRAECQTILPMGDGEEFLEEMATFDPDSGTLKLVKNDLSFKYDGPHRNLYAFNLYSVDGDVLKFGEASEQRKLGDKGKICTVLDKGKALDSLLKEVKAAGVEVFPGTVVTGVSKTNGSVTVTTNTGKDFTGTFAIAADGANSRMAQALGFNKDRGYYSSMNVVGYYVKNMKVPDPDTLYYVVAQYENTAVITAVAPRPNENEHAVVFICLDCRVDLIKFHKYLTEETKLSSWFEGTQSKLVNSSCGNMWSTIEKPYKDNVLLVGDVMFCQESENFGALLSGGLAARAVADAIKSNNPTEEGIKSYLEWWDTAFYSNPKYQRDQVMGNYMLGAILNNEEIGYLFNKLEVVLPASIHPYTLFAELGKEIGAIAGEVEKEKPQVLAGLGRMQQENPADILKDEASAGFPNR